MNDFRWLHELIFGALLGNIILGLSFVKLLYRVYKQYDAFMYRHRLLWLDYCKRNNMMPGREFNDRSAAYTIPE